MTKLKITFVGATDGVAMQMTQQLSQELGAEGDIKIHHGCHPVADFTKVSNSEAFVKAVQKTFGHKRHEILMKHADRDKPTEFFVAPMRSGLN